MQVINENFERNKPAVRFLLDYGSNCCGITIQHVVKLPRQLSTAASSFPILCKETTSGPELYVGPGFSVPP